MSEATPNLKLQRPPLQIELTLNDGTTKEIKMTYGLFNDLQRTISDPQVIVETVMSDPWTRDYIFRRCLTDSKKAIKDPETDLIPIEEMPIDDPEELDKLMQWVAGHMLYFFATSAGGMKRLAEVFKVTRKADAAPPVPSTTGSES